MTHTNPATSADRPCPKCGETIEPSAPGGLCPRCLMEFVAFSTQELDGIPNPSKVDIEQARAAFPQLEILELVGRGGMGTVYKARQIKLDRIVALKLLADGLATQGTFAERFEREGRLLAKLNHPNIVAVYDFGHQAGMYYLMMEYVDGVNLRQAYASSHFTQQQALAVIPKICEALQYAHEAGVLHRDIKPENILLNSRGQVKIADFGIGKLAAPDERTGLTGLGSSIGTPHYMAPEQVERPSDVDHRADIYSLGVVFYEMLTGELPLGRFAPPSQFTDVNSRLDEVVLRALEKDRQKRQQSAKQVQTEIEHASENLSRAITTTEATGLSPLRKSVWLFRAFVSLIMLLFGVFIALVALDPKFAISEREWLVAMAFAIFGLPSSILAWIHLSHVRKSGNRSGTWVSMPAAVLFPVALVCALLLTFCLRLTFASYPTLAPGRGIQFAMIVLIPFAALSSVLGIRQVLKWTKQGPTEPSVYQRHPGALIWRRWVFIPLAVLWGCFGVWGLLVAEGNVHQRQAARLHEIVPVPNISLSVKNSFTIQNVLFLEIESDHPSTAVLFEFQTNQLSAKASITAAETIHAISGGEPLLALYPGEAGRSMRFPSQSPRNWVALAMESHDEALAAQLRLRRMDNEKLAPMYSYSSDYFVLSISSTSRLLAMRIRQNTSLVYEQGGIAESPKVLPYLDLLSIYRLTPGSLPPQPPESTENNEPTPDASREKVVRLEVTISSDGHVTLHEPGTLFPEQIAVGDLESFLAKRGNLQVDEIVYTTKSQETSNPEILQEVIQIISRWQSSIRKAVQATDSKSTSAIDKTHSLDLDQSPSSDVKSGAEQFGEGKPTGDIQPIQPTPNL